MNHLRTFVNNFIIFGVQLMVLLNKSILLSSVLLLRQWQKAVLLLQPHFRQTTELLLAYKNKGSRPPALNREYCRNPLISRCFHAFHLSFRDINTTVSTWRVRLKKSTAQIFFRV